MNTPSVRVAIAVLLSSAGARLSGSTFDGDLTFLRAHTNVIVLGEASGDARLALSPAWQGRVLTSTAEGSRGLSFGWINRELIASQVRQPHMNAFGGEDRLWLGPEGGQYSIYFAPGTAFQFDNWFVPPAFDTLPFKVEAQSERQARFSSEFTLVNYSGARFSVRVDREVRLLSSSDAWSDLGIRPDRAVKLVAYESDNRLTNAGARAWQKETGLLSIWILGMFSPSLSTTIVAPFQPGTRAELGPIVTSDYFGAVPPDRLKIGPDAVFLKGDGRYRSKIGINPRRSRRILGSYDAEHGVLTIVQYDQPKDASEYVNSLWKLQEFPYSGDVANAYNDGPPSPGAKPMGPFVEMESSSPAAALAPGATMAHLHRTFHLTGPAPSLDLISRNALGVPLASVEGAFAGQ